MAKKVFKHHQFRQIMFLPPSLDEMKYNEPLHFEQIAPEAVKQVINEETKYSINGYERL